MWLDAAAGEPRQGGRRSPPGRDYFNQDPNIIQFVMENPTDRVTYGDLRMIRAEFEELMQLSIEAGTIKHPIRVRDATWTRASPHNAPARGDRALMRRAAALRCCSRSPAAGRAGAADAPALKAGVFDPPRSAPDFALRGSDGAELRLEPLPRQGGRRWPSASRSCPDVCPVTLGTLGEARKKLGAEGRRLQVVYVTVDPERDDAERMRTYLANFDPSFVGGTGTPEQLDAVRKEYGIARGEGDDARPATRSPTRRPSI